MKATRLSSFLIVLLLMVGFTACKKDNEVNPKAPADTVTGTFDGYQAISGTNSVNLPLPDGTNYRLIINKASDTSVSMRLQEFMNTSVTDDSDIGTAEVKANGSAVDFYDGTVKFATFQNNEIDFDFTSSGTNLHIKFRRK